MLHKLVLTLWIGLFLMYHLYSLQLKIQLNNFYFFHFIIGSQSRNHDMADLFLSTSTDNTTSPAVSAIAWSIAE